MRTRISALARACAADGCPNLLDTLHEWQITRRCGGGSPQAAPDYLYKHHGLNKAKARDPYVGAQARNQALLPSACVPIK